MLFVVQPRLHLVCQKDTFNKRHKIDLLLLKSAKINRKSLWSKAAPQELEVVRIAVNSLHVLKKTPPINLILILT